MSFIFNFDPVLRVPHFVSCHSDLDNYNVASFKCIKAALVGELSERMMSDAFGGGGGFLQFGMHDTLGDGVAFKLKKKSYRTLDVGVRTSVIGSQISFSAPL